MSMPHSPRLGSRLLWLRNSCTGAFCTVDQSSGRFEVLAFVPGLVRELAFVGGPLAYTKIAGTLGLEITALG
jgi:hypothetical protein